MSEQAAFDRELAVNRQAYELLREEIRRKYAGQYVGMAFGKIIAVDPDFEKVCQVIDSLNPFPEHQAVFWAASDPEMDASFENLSVEYE